MTEVSPELLTAIMMVGIFVGVLSGFPIAIPIGFVALAVGFAILGTPVFAMMYQRFFSLITNYTLLAVPLFVFMGAMLQRSGLAERIFDALYMWFAGLKGGLAISTVLLGTILATCVGIIGASVTMLSLAALPAMIKRGYSKSLASGAVCAGGTLGILIPPSIMLVIYGPMAGVSVGKMFMGAFSPGLLLCVLYCTYIIIRCWLLPQSGPAVPVEERLRVSFVKRTGTLVVAVAPTALLIMSVLGVIFLGIAPPTEAAAAGALVSALLAIAYRKFNLHSLYETLLQTMKLTSMVLLIGGLAFAFVGVFISIGCGHTIEVFILAAPGGKWGAFAVIMFLYFLLGFFIDWIGIMFIIVPIVSPIAPLLGFNPVWFGIMICINLQASFMTPPMASALFFLRGSAPPELGVTMGDIIRGVIPFVLAILLGLLLCALFPQIITWLPELMIK